jgi:O-antigen ligase
MTSPIARWSIFAYLLLVPCTAVWVPLRSHDYSRVVAVLVGAICAMHTANALWQPRHAIHTLVPRSPGWRLWLLAAGTVALASVLHAPIVTKAFQEFGVWLGCGFVAITIASSFDEGDAVRLGQVVVVATLSYNCAALLVPILGLLLDGYAMDIVELPLGYDNRRFLNHVQTVALPLTAAYFHQLNQSKRWALAAWLALVAGFALLYLTGGRGTFLGLAVGVLLSPLWLGRSCWPGVRPLVFSAGAGYLIYAMMFTHLSNPSGSAGQPDLAGRAMESGTVRTRLLLAWLSVEYIKESPWLGVGPMHFAHWPNWAAAHPHNVFLQVGAEWGLPMLALLLIAATVGLAKLLRTIRRSSVQEGKLVGGLLGVTCVAVLVDGCVSGNFVMPVSQLWIAVCAGAAAHWQRHTRPGATAIAQSSCTRASPAKLLAAALVTTQVLQLVLVTTDLASLDEILQRARILSGSTHASPRFWVNGWF